MLSPVVLLHRVKLVDDTGAPAKWTVDPLGKPFDVDPEADGDAWGRRLTELVQRRVGGTGSRTEWDGGAVPPRLTVSITESALTSRLVLESLRAGGCYLRVEGEGQPADDQIEPWVTAAIEAARQASQPHVPIAWEAAVGPWPSLRSTRDHVGRLVTVGPLELEPYAQVVVEGVPDRYSNWRSGQVFWSEPLIVRGSSVVVDWWAAEVQAMQELHRLCALLGLVHKCAWIVREGPWPKSSEPHVLPTVIGVESSLLVTKRIALNRGSAVEPPAWLLSAWGRLEANAALAAALTGYQQGLELADRHPSQAAVAFVAAIETIGSEVEKPVGCEKCETFRGSARAFRAGLRKVVSDEEAKPLDTLYGSRSKTAHEARLYGSESYFGAGQSPSAWRREPRWEFEHFHLRRLISVCRDLLIQELS